MGQGELGEAGSGDVELVVSRSCLGSGLEGVDRGEYGDAELGEFLDFQYSTAPTRAIAARAIVIVPFLPK